MRHKKASQSNESNEPPTPEIDPRGESQHPLDDDDELAHIGDFTPPPIEVGPDSDSKTGYDAPPPMVKPAEHDEPSKPIEHVPALGPLADQDDEGGEHPPASAPILSQPPRKIRTFEQRLGRGGHETKWKRQPNVTGTGAIHVKSFHCKLTGDSLEFLDSQVNEWLDEHPEYEVKMVTTSIGEWTGKLKEPALIVNVWV
ncbi:MAG: hypothetical protein K8E66_13500 [Phycisphaerales bacterium]|nr:hypothetical protein [Phycisphaerales bacterium]